MITMGSRPIWAITGDYQTETTLFNLLNDESSSHEPKPLMMAVTSHRLASIDKITCSGEWNNTIIVFSDTNTNESDDQDLIYRVLSLPKTTPCIQWKASLGRQWSQFNLGWCKWR